MHRKFTKILTVLLLLALVLSCTGCGEAHKKDLLLHLSFNEGKGTTVADSSGNLPEETLEYLYTKSAYMPSQEPQWRTSGIDGGCILMDGTSTFVSYTKNDVSIGGEKLTISLWVAPRTFEWDDPNGAVNGNDTLTGLVGQSNKEKKQGFLLGYQRHGALSFQVGTGDDWLTIWTNGDNLQTYQWNQVTAVFDAPGGEMALYLNGEKVTSRSVPEGASIQPAKKNLLIGRNGEGERLTAGYRNVVSGLLDEVKLYSCAFTSDEVRKAYEAVKVPEIAFEDIWLQNILTEDYTRPQYHGAPLQFWMNEPHAPVYYNGMYHLFFQENMSGSYWRNICWGHLVSTDLVHWKQVKEAIVPMADTVVPDGVWSGGATLDKNGVPLLFFTAGDDSYMDHGLISNQNIGVAYPKDLTDPNLTEWVVCKELAIAQQKGEGRRGEFRDSHIWKEGDTWCMLVCSGSTTSSGGTALLYTTDTLELMPDGTVNQNWQYHGPIYEMQNQSVTYGTSWELPILLPVSNKEGTITKYMFSISPAPASTADNKVYYFLGDFDLTTGKFTPEEGFEMPHLLDYGSNVFTGPSAIYDPVSGDIIVCSIMQDQRGAGEQGGSGWAHTVGLTRKIWLKDDGSDLMIAPIDAIDTLEGEVLAQGENLTVAQANELLSKVDADMYHLVVTATVDKAQSFGIELKKGGKWDATTYTYDVAAATITGRTENKGAGAASNVVSGALPVENGKLTMDIYVDRSLIEAFFNEYKALTIRAYTEEPDSRAISLFAEGDVTVDSLYVASMGSIFKDSGK